MTLVLSRSNREPADNGAYRPARARFEFDFSALKIGQYFEFPAECSAGTAWKVVGRANDAAQASKSGREYVTRSIGKARVCFRIA